MTDIALITTTINLPTVLQRYKEIADNDRRIDLEIIVAGDMKEAPGAFDFVETIGGRWLTPRDQDDLCLTSKYSELVGWKTIQRRNLALLAAIRSGADLIVTVDDDNHPLSESYFQSFVEHIRGTRERAVVQTSNHWHDPAWNSLTPPVHHRGFPYSQRTTRHDPSVHYDYVSRVDTPVAAGLWLGDPDIDAMERLVNMPETVGFLGDCALKPGTWSPFNTQNTCYRADVALLGQCLVNVGRFDDIWMSYIARAVLDSYGWGVAYGEPLVRQERNDHDLFVDLEAELFGYQWTDRFCESLRTADLGSGPIIDRLAAAYDAVQWIIPEQTIATNRAWLEEVSA
jgi:hypothetical protein